MIYCRTNEQIKDMDIQCKRRLDDIRRASRVELDNAIRHIHAQYKKQYENNISKPIHIDQFKPTIPRKLFTKYSKGIFQNFLSRLGGASTLIFLEIRG